MKMHLLKAAVLGDVDHGKSTLLGRILADSGSLPAERRRELLTLASSLPTNAFALALDGLSEEQQGCLTLDTHQILVELQGRPLSLIDVPGHATLLKNMVTGATQADAAIVVVDATAAVSMQMRKHVEIAQLLGIRQFVVAVNKMDTVEWKSEPFVQAVGEVATLLKQHAMVPAAAIAISALHGDNIIKPSEQMPWYRGPTLEEALRVLSPDTLVGAHPARLVVQDVYPHGGMPLYVGRVESGVLIRGAMLRSHPRGELARVVAIERFGEPPLEQAICGACVGVRLSGASDEAIRPGNLLAEASCSPLIAHRVDASVLHLATKPLVPGEELTFRSACSESSATIERITSGLTTEEAMTIQFGNVARVRLLLSERAVAEPFSEVPALGRFTLARGTRTVAAGIIHGGET